MKVRQLMEALSRLDPDMGCCDLRRGLWLRQGKRS